NTEFFVGLISFVLTVLLMPIFIQTYNKAKISGQQMHEDVKQHQAKAGTPTMGGIVFLLVGSLVALLGLLWSGQWTASAGMVLLILVLYGLVGFLDDFLKVFRRINEGLNPRQKLFLQLVGGLLFFLIADSQGGTLNVFGYALQLGG
ncbi:phospho-N-acetylmuramoyl-pentapeptide-transferase, partial [Streptococcus danieliae]|nr:phospho-N-acetylmuramoyl-pentapeptide-transferase [Streptococcus danieliae]